MAKSIRKKKWYRIIAGAEFKNTEIGETYCDDPSKTIGRKIKVSLSSLIGDMRKQNIIIIFKIKEVKGEQLNTEIYGYELLGAHIKRLVRKGRNKIDNSFLVNFKDNAKARVKPVIFTRKKTKNRILTGIRKKSEEFVKDFCLKNDFDRLIGSLIGMRIQIELKKNLSKIYPVAGVDFRKVIRIN